MRRYLFCWMKCVPAVFGFVLANGITGCAAIAVSGAGTVAGLELSNRAVKGKTSASLQEADRQAREAFNRIGIQEISQEEKRDARDGMGTMERNLIGKKDDLEIDVELKKVATSSATQIDVLTHNGSLQRDDRMAQRVLEEIVGERKL